jgi:hypothetical protein
MAFTTINPSAIEVGDPLTKDLFDTIKANEDDHESRLNTLETNASRVEIFALDIRNADSSPSFTGFAYARMISDITITNAFVEIYEKGSLTGALEIDIKRSTTDKNDTSFTSIFTTKPKITMASASDYDTSTNQVFAPSQINLSVGDYLRLDITELPTSGVIGKFIVTCYGE